MSNRAIVAVALCGGVVAVLAAVAPPVLAISLAVTLAAAVCAADVDARSARLPDELLVMATVPTAAVLVHELAVGHGLAAAGSVALGVAVFAGPVLVLHLVSPAAMGFGDVKLGVALGASMGLIDPRFGLVALCAASAATVLVGVSAHRSALAFGPGLVFGWVVALIASATFGQGPLPWR